MLTTIEYKNKIKPTHQSVYTKPELSGTDGIPYFLKIITTKSGVAPIIVFFPQTANAPIASSERPTIDDLIKKYTTTAHGKKLWKAANDKLNAELHQDMISGRLNKVKYYRMMDNMDQKTLANLSGIKQPNISRIEHPGYVADISTLKKIADVFGIDYKELIP